MGLISKLMENMPKFGSPDGKKGVSESEDDLFAQQVAVCIAPEPVPLPKKMPINLEGTELSEVKPKLQQMKLSDVGVKQTAGMPLQVKLEEQVPLESEVKTDDLPQMKSVVPEMTEPNELITEESITPAEEVEASHMRGMVIPPLRLDMIPGFKATTSKTRSTVPSDIEALINVKGPDSKVQVKTNISKSATPQTIDPTVTEKVIKLEALADQFDARLLSMVQRGEKIMRITVDPESMGRMTVLCREMGEKLTVEIYADHDAVRDALARQEESVRSLFETNGMKLSGFDVMSGGEQEARRQEQRWVDEEAEFVSGIYPAEKEVEMDESEQCHRQTGVVSIIA